MDPSWVLNLLSYIGNSPRVFLVNQSVIYKQQLCAFFFFLGPHLRHMEVPRLGVESELQLLAYTTATATQDPSHITSITYITAPSNAGSLTR